MTQVGNRPGNPSEEHSIHGCQELASAITVATSSSTTNSEVLESIEKPIVVAAQGHCLGAA